LKIVADAVQEPAMQVMFEPQLVPSGTLPVSTQIGSPVLHEIAAVWQGFVDAQETPALQGRHAPLAEQTRFVPQAVPAAKKVRSVHTGAPVLHSNVAVAEQGFAVSQGAPCVQGEKLLTVRVSVATWDGEAASVAVTSKLTAPAEGGVPLSVPSGPSVSQPGNPLAVQVNGPMPPLTGSAKVYALPWIAVGTPSMLIASGLAMRRLSVRVAT
jgi:hypothetical protein